MSGIRVALSGAAGRMGRVVGPGLEGTPGIVLDDGEMIPGYVSPPQLLQHLKDPERRIDPARSN